MEKIERSELEIICKVIFLEVRRNRMIEFTENSKNKLFSQLGPVKIRIKNYGDGKYKLTYLEKGTDKKGELKSEDYEPLKKLGDYLFGRDFSKFPESPVFDYFTS